MINVVKVFWKVCEQGTGVKVLPVSKSSSGGFMRKFLLVGLVCLFSSFAFGQSAKYTELLNKAKKFDAEKNYAYALGYYYDAVKEDFENCKEAYDRFIEIENVIKEGKPGFDEYDDFSIYDGWVFLLKNAEKYWTEHAYEIYCYEYKFAQKSLDMEARTADYKLTVEYRINRKYSRLIKAMTDGLCKSWTKNWKGITVEKEYDKVECSWPKYPVKGNSTDYKKDGVATFIRQHYGYTSLDNKKIFDEDRKCSFANENNMMSIDVEICAPDGRKISSVDNLYEDAIVKKIPQKDIKLFEDGSVKVVVKSFNLYEGTALDNSEWGINYKELQEKLEKLKMTDAPIPDSIKDYVNRYCIYVSVQKSVEAGILITEYKYEDVVYDLLEPAEWNFSRRGEPKMLPAIVEKISALTGIKHEVNDYYERGGSFSLKRGLSQKEQEAEDARIEELKRQEEEKKLQKERMRKEREIDRCKSELTSQIYFLLKEKGKLSKKQLYLYIADRKEFMKLAKISEMNNEQTFDFVIESLLQQELIILKGSKYSIKK